MRRRRKSQVRAFSLFATFLMIFSLIVPGFVGAEGNGEISVSAFNTKQTAEVKVSDQLLDQFKEQDKVTFLVKFAEKADVYQVAEEARADAKKQKLSAYNQELRQRSSVISALKATALESQGNVKAFLEAEMEKGSVDEIHSYHIVNGMAVTATKEVAEKIASFSEVEKILPNETRKLMAPVDLDAEVPENSLQNIEWSVDRINAPDAWAMGFDGTGTVVASLDSGADLYHPALERKYRGYDEATGEFDHTYSWFDPSEGDSYPTDGNSHGTHVTGTMVGSEADGTNQVGVAPGAEWIAVKVFNADGDTTDQILLDGAEWLLHPGGDASKAPDVVNNSWSGGRGIDEWYTDAVDAWRAADIFPAFAAGNTGLFEPGGPGSVANPGNYQQSFAVGATTNTDDLASFSLQGPSPYGEIKPDISAPGAAVRSSVPGGGYSSFNGTSMATPAVAGVVALLRSVNENLSVDELEEILMNTADAEAGKNATFPESPNNGYGYGIVDAFAAVSSIASGLGTIQGTVSMDGEDTEEPTYSHEGPTENYSGLEMDLSIEVADNVSITSVALQYGDHVVDATQLSGDYKAGLYKVSIPGEDFEVGTFTYNWVINDFGNNEVITEDYSIEVKAGITNGYFEDLEKSYEPVGWQKIGTNNPWEHGVPTTGPETAFSGEKVFATMLDDNYPSSMNARMVMPPIDVPADEDSYLQFKSWHHFEYSATSGRSWDYGRLEISTDLENWTTLEEFAQENEAWNTKEYDLSEYAGERVYISFYTYSDGSVTRTGWYIDDISLSESSMYDNDNVPPTYVHEAPVEVYAGFNLPLTVEVMDDMLIGGATLSYLDQTGEWQNVEAEEVENNGVQGIYSAKIPGDAISTPSISYQWTVSDFNGNSNTSETYEVSVVDGITVGFSEDFEEEPVGWQLTGDVNPWSWGEPTSGPNAAVSGENVYATNLGGDYPTNMRAYLIMPAVDVPEGESYLSFQSWHNFEQSSAGRAWDYGQVVVSTDGENWTELQQFQGESDGYELAEIDLSEYAGQSVLLAFYGYSDGSVTKLGWYIDDVAITDQLQGAEPTNMDQEFMKNKIETSVKPGEKVEASKVVGEEITEDEEPTVTKNETVKPSALPLAATVTVLETGRSTNTTPWNGNYSLLHGEGEYTVVAETYGFASAEQTVTVTEDETTEANFVLEELPKATVSGSVTNALSGEAIEGATLLLMEDANIQPVQTDAGGNFDLTAYEGSYTVKVLAADYTSKEVEINLEEDMTLEIQLDPFYTIPGGEIGYDDGTIENARAFYDAGNGWAVKMSLPEGKDQAIVTDGVFQFYDPNFPSPGGTAFAVEVWSAGEDGLPDQKLAGPVQAEAVRSQAEWTVVDLRQHDIQVDGDFFMVYVQTQPNTGAPGLATDENGVNAKRSYQKVGNAFEPVPAAEGNYMIRARVAYGVEGAVLAPELHGSFTNETAITVNGTASPNTSVELYKNDESIGSQVVSEEGTFAFEVELTEGVNELVAHTYVDGEKAAISDPITVTLDKQLPVVTIDSPGNGDVLNSGSVTVDGTIQDANLANVTVNGEEATVSEGNYEKRIFLDAGENTIEVIATDLAGNITTKVITVTSDNDAPVLENIQPAKDLNVSPGDKVVVSFTSDTEGGEASFAVNLPGTPSLTSATGNEMVEVEPGVYKGTWVVPNVTVDGAIIEVSITDAAGNRTVTDAPGKLFVESIAGGIDRISGDTRNDTAIEVSKEGWDSSDVVILARGDHPADALAGVPLAYHLDAPILLTPTEYLWEDILPEIERLGATEVIILGGNGAVGESVENSLAASGLTVTRLAGDTRYDTAAAIALELAWENGADKVVIANGDNFGDALSVGSFAAQEGLPILLVEIYGDEIPVATQAALDQLGVQETLVIGGTFIISDRLMNKLPEPTRISGSDRYKTNVAVAEYFNFNNDHIYVATGATFHYADALSGGVLAAKNGSAVIFVDDRSVLPVTADFIKENDTKRITIFGGEGALSAKIEDELTKLLK